METHLNYSVGNGQALTTEVLTLGNSVRLDFGVISVPYVINYRAILSQNSTIGVSLLIV